MSRAFLDYLTHSCACIGDKAREVLMRSKLPVDKLGAIWYVVIARCLSEILRYIWQEYVERQTLKELVNDEQGLAEDEAWRLFRQLVDALVHMASLNIVCVVWLVSRTVLTFSSKASSRHQAE